ncbi:NepR family anti-sigma factor [Hyphomonas sp.]|uniref:NepR family anti-sigma factor n=1 Tax=Hyphomonas sp. TaxID=87 RepID=UPI0030FCD149|tara:strand:+ start:1145 stop:1336 length:192 start_codon:yes stop_codon:yes gene_type:complete
MNKKKQPGQQKSDADLKRRGAKIGDQLRRIYEDVAKEEVPDEFLKLLEEADKKKSSKPSTSDE